jgi:hypothetical protein
MQMTVAYFKVLDIRLERQENKEKTFNRVSRFWYRDSDVPNMKLIITSQWLGSHVEPIIAYLHSYGISNKNIKYK